MDSSELKNRTKQFALKIIDLVNALPGTNTGNIIGRQILKSGTSIGANYRAACRARSNADFIYKMGIVEEESDETGFWLEILVESGMKSLSECEYLLKEANEFTAMSVSSIKTARKN